MKKWKIKRRKIKHPISETGYMEERYVEEIEGKCINCGFLFKKIIGSSISNFSKIARYTYNDTAWDILRCPSCDKIIHDNFSSDVYISSIHDTMNSLLSDIIIVTKYIDKYVKKNDPKLFYESLISELRIKLNSLKKEHNERK